MYSISWIILQQLIIIENFKQNFLLRSVNISFYRYRFTSTLIYIYIYMCAHISHSLRFISLSLSLLFLFMSYPMLRNENDFNHILYTFINNAISSKFPWKQDCKLKKNKNKSELFCLFVEIRLNGFVNNWMFPTDFNHHYTI